MQTIRIKYLLPSLSLFFLLFLSFSTTAEEELPSNYDRARWHPIHFKPMVDNATNDQCLACHKEILQGKVKQASPAGVKAEDTLAWYQTLTSYEGEQETFHRRHLVTPLAKELMNLQCNTCHQGNDPREETPVTFNPDNTGFNLRKMVNVEETCLKCHGGFDYKIMTGLPGPWHEVRDMMGNSCMACHMAFRTHRHQVNYLRPDNIEKAGTKDSDTCYGCHGGRSWYMTNYPYPRHAWQGQAPEKTPPEWAKDRPTESEARFLKAVPLNDFSKYLPEENKKAVPAKAEEVEKAPALEKEEKAEDKAVAKPDAQALIKKQGYICMSCHQVAAKVVGPSYKEIAKKYKDDPKAAETLAKNIKAGSVGTWGQIPMPPNVMKNDDDMKIIVDWILSLE